MAYLLNPNFTTSENSVLGLSDVDNDGILDLVTSYYSPFLFYGSANYYSKGDGHGGFTGSRSMSDSILIQYGLKETYDADVNSDGFMDRLAVVNGDLTLSLGGTNGFQPAHIIKTRLAWPYSSPAGSYYYGFIRGVTAVDLNGDGRPDLVVEYSGILAPHGGSVVVSVFLDTRLPVGHDFNGDGSSDILWRADNGVVAIASINNASQTAWRDNGVVPPDFKPAATGDFNGDGTTDILWHADNGVTAIAGIQGGQQASWQPLETYPMAFIVAGAGDFNADGTSDILWHAANGTTAISTIIAGKQAAWMNLGVYPTAFQPTATGDFNGDGTSDILWRADNGTIAISTIESNVQTGWADLGIIPPAFEVAGVGDFNGDGTSDLLWHAADGQTAISTIVNNAQARWTDLGIVPADFLVAQIGDYNKDGVSDVLWRTSNGSTAITTSGKDLFSQNFGALVVGAADPTHAQTRWTDLGIIPAAFRPVAT